MGSLFIYLQMKGGFWFKPTTIIFDFDFWAEGRQRTGEEGAGTHFPGERSLSLGQWLRSLLNGVGKRRREA